MIFKSTEFYGFATLYGIYLNFDIKKKCTEKNWTRDWDWGATPDLGWNYFSFFPIKKWRVHYFEGHLSISLNYAPLTLKENYTFQTEYSSPLYRGKGYCLEIRLPYSGCAIWFPMNIALYFELFSAHSSIIIGLLMPVYLTDFIQALVESFIYCDTLMKINVPKSVTIP